MQPIIRGISYLDNYDLDLSTIVTYKNNIDTRVHRMSTCDNENLKWVSIQTQKESVISNYFLKTKPKFPHRAFTVEIMHLDVINGTCEATRILIDKSFLKVVNV